MLRTMPRNMRSSSSFHISFQCFLIKPRYNTVKLRLAKVIKTIRMFSMRAEWKKAMLSWCVEKPPVAIVEKAWLIASKGPIPPR